MRSNVQKQHDTIPKHRDFTSVFLISRQELQKGPGPSVLLSHILSLDSYSSDKWGGFQHLGNVPLSSGSLVRHREMEGWAIREQKGWWRKCLELRNNSEIVQ